MNPELNLVLTKEGLDMSDDLNAPNKRLRNQDTKYSPKQNRYATHFLVNETDLRYIRELLERNSRKTHSQ